MIASNKLMVFCSFALCLSLSFTDIFVFAGTPLATYMAIFVLLILILREKRLFFYNLITDKTNWILLILAIFFLTSYFLNTTNERSWIYCLGFVSLASIVGIGLNQIINFKAIPEAIKLTLPIALFFVCALAIQDWYSQNFYNHSYSFISQLFRRDLNFNSELLGLIRARGTFEEAAFLALFLNATFPIILATEKNKQIINLLLILVFLTYILTLSLAAYISLIFALILSSILLRGLVYNLSLLSIICFSILIIIYFLGLENQLIERIFNPNDVSKVERLENYTMVLNALRDNSALNIIFGNGPASFRETYKTNPISSYLFVLHDFGAISLALIASLFFKATSSIMRLNQDVYIKQLWLISLFSVIVHFSVIGNIWHPIFWFSIIACINVKNFYFNNTSPH